MVTNRDWSVGPTLLGIAALTSFASLWLLEISWLSSILVLIVVVVLMQLGRVLGASAGFGEVGVGAGIVLGVGILVFSGQLLLLLGVPARLAHWTILIFMGICTLGLRKTSLATPKSSPWKLTGEVLFCLAIALLVMAVRHPWLLSFAIPVFLLERHLQSATPRRNYIVLLIGTVAMGWIIAQQLRPERWWYYYQGNDSQFFESLSWSIAQWGVLEHPGNVGGSIANYHWLSYAFFGQLSQLALLNPWDALMKIGLLLVPFSIIGVLGAQLDFHKGTTWLIVLLGTISLPNGVSDSLTFSVLTALGLLHLAELAEFQRPTHPVKLQSVLVLASATLVFSKVTTSIVTLAILLLIYSLSFRSQKRRSLAPSLCLAFSGIFIYLAFFQNHPASPSGYRLDMLNLVGRIISKAESPQFAVWLFVCVSVLLFGSTSDILSSHRSNLVGAAVIASAVSICSEFAVIGSEIQYWTLPSLWLAIYAIVGKFSTHGDCVRSRYRESLTIFGIVFGVLFVVSRDHTYHFLYDKFNIAQRLGDDVWDIFQSNGLIYVIIAVVMAVRLTRHSKSRTNLAVMTLSMAVVVGYTFAAQKVRFYQLDIHQYGADFATNSSGGNSAPFAEGDLLSVAAYIRENTNIKTVLASNNFCCSGQDWWNSIVQDPTRYDPDNSDVAPTWGGDNYLLPTETRRRFLMQGLGFQTGEDIASPEQIRRMTLSLQFANSPTTEIANALKSYGVSGYVANLGLTEHRDWSDFAIAKFRNGNFVYLELK
jgi:hypothetical protein